MTDILKPVLPIEPPLINYDDDGLPDGPSVKALDQTINFFLHYALDYLERLKGLPRDEAIGLSRELDFNTFHKKHKILLDK